MGARFYAPTFGVWTRADPFGVTSPEHFVAADFAAANPYAYAKDSPLLVADRDGHFWNIAIGAAVGGLVGGGIEAGRQYWATGRIESWGRIGAAASGGAISGAMTAACPVAGLSGFFGGNAVSGAAGGMAQRLVESGGQSAGTLKEAVFDAGIGVATAGIMKGGGAIVGAAVKRAPSVVRAIAQRVAGRVEGSMCFAAGTLVVTADGLRPIETLRVGDLVLSLDEATGASTLRPVTRVFVTPDAQVLDLSFRGVDGFAETITVTPSHPFWVEGTGWTAARDLSLNVPLRTAEGTLATLSAALSREDRITVFNLEVAETHTYFVGKTGAWVHNACGPEVPRATMIGQESGPSIVVPREASGPTAVRSGTGVKYTGGSGGNGLNGRVTDVRIMEPTAPSRASPGYPDGYASYGNGSGQTVNPSSGHTVAPADLAWHIPLTGATE
jgi:RHS repeat-associated protein